MTPVAIRLSPMLPALLTVPAKQLLIGELYQFPQTSRISLFLKVHHLTLAPSHQAKVTEVAKRLHIAKSLSKTDIETVVKEIGAPIETFVPALIDCAHASSLWIYAPSAADKATLRDFGWHV